MTDDEITTRAQQIAHEHTPACRNRPANYSGHGRSCTKLAAVIAQAMREARDGATK